MIDVVAVVEGPTEQAFISRVLAPHLVLEGVSVRPILSGKSGKRGGVPRWSAAKQDLLRVLRQGRCCTTMFDFYGMPLDWPGRREAAEQPPERRGEVVEASIVAALEEAMGDDFDPRRFVAYVQMHEFEALTFADPEVLGAQLSALPPRLPGNLVPRLREIVERAGGPEQIDDGYETCPSRRISRLVSGYRKPLLGPIIAEAIGIDSMRARCVHFGEWVSRLEALAT